MQEPCHSITPFLNMLKPLREECFREYPYLYADNLASENQFLETYLDSEESIFVIVLADEKIIALGTGIPLIDTDDIYKQSFIEKNINISQYFYIGSVIVHRNFRGRLLGLRILTQLERLANLRDYKHITCAIIERSDKHDLRPEKYRPFGHILETRGYSKLSDINATCEWRDVGDTHESPKKLSYYVKHH